MLGRVQGRGCRGDEQAGHGRALCSSHTHLPRRTSAHPRAEISLYLPDSSVHPTEVLAPLDIRAY